MMPNVQLYAALLVAKKCRVSLHCWLRNELRNAAQRLSGAHAACSCNDRKFFAGLGALPGPCQVSGCVRISAAEEKMQRQQRAAVIHPLMVAHFC